MNVFLLLFKFIAGIFGHSSAMLADAVHSFSDFITDIIVVVFVKISALPEDEGHDYGHGKYETLAGLLVSLFLFFVGLGILVNASLSIYGFYHGRSLAVPSQIALWAALISIVMKELLYRYTVRVSKIVRSPALEANAWHHRSDAFSSVAALIGIGGAMILGKDWAILDPVAAFLVSLFIIKASFGLMKSCLDDFLERSLPDELEKKMEEIILSVPGVGFPHHLRTRRIGSYYAIDVHIRMDGGLSLHEAHQKSVEVEKRLRCEFGEFTYITIHLEPFK